MYPISPCHVQVPLTLWVLLAGTRLLWGGRSTGLAQYLDAAEVTNREYPAFILVTGRAASAHWDGTTFPLGGLYLLVYALGLWRQKVFALPMAYAYAAYVIINLALFVTSQPPASETRTRLLGLVYAAVAIGVSSGTAVLLTRHQKALT